MKIAFVTLLGAILALCGLASGDTPGNPNEPNASFVWEQRGLTVLFKDTTPYEIYNIAWRWDFGDGEISNVQNPTHRYPGYGNYTVYFTVWNYAGFSNTESETIWVREGVGVNPDYGAMFWAMLMLVLGGALVVIFGKFSTVRIGGALVLLIGLMMIIINPPTIGLSESFRTDSSFVVYGIPLMFSVALIALLALAKNPHVRIGLVLAFIITIMVLMAM